MRNSRPGFCGEHYYDVCFSCDRFGKTFGALRDVCRDCFIAIDQSMPEDLRSAREQWEAWAKANDEPLPDFLR